MNRRHTVKDYRNLIDLACTKIPGLGLGTDLMVGFPGETDAAFRNTLAVATDLPFSYLHVFPYSRRPGTAAMRLKQGFPSASVKKRADLLLASTEPSDSPFTTRKSARLSQSSLKRELEMPIASAPLRTS